MKSLQTTTMVASPIPAEPQAARVEGMHMYVAPDGRKILLAQPCKPPNLDDPNHNRWVRVLIPTHAVVGVPFKSFVFGQQVFIEFHAPFKPGMFFYSLLWIAPLV